MSTGELMTFDPYLWFPASEPVVEHSAPFVSIPISTSYRGPTVVAPAAAIAPMVSAPPVTSTMVTRVPVPAVLDMPAFLSMPPRSRATDEAGPSQPRGGSHAHLAARCGCEFEFRQLVSTVSRLSHFVRIQHLETWSRLSALGVQMETFADHIASLDSLTDMAPEDLEANAAAMRQMMMELVQAIKACAPLAAYVPPPPPPPQP